MQLPDIIKDILRRWDIVFLVIFALASGVGSILKSRKLQQQRKAGRGRRPAGPAGRPAGRPPVRRPPMPMPLDTADEELDPEMAAGLEEFFQRVEASVEKPPPPPPPPAAPAPQLAASLSGFEEFIQAERGAGPMGGHFEGIEAMPDSTTAGGRLKQAGAGTQRQVGRAWRPTAGWREALILREVLGPPRALRQDALPGLLGGEG